MNTRGDSRYDGIRWCGVVTTTLIRHTSQVDDVLRLLARNGSAPPCRSSAYGETGESATTAPAALESNVLGFSLPLHVDVSGLADVDAVRHVLGLYDGDSLLVDAPAVLGTPGVVFSRVGGILAGLVTAAGISRGNSDRAIAFVVDTDIVVRPGALEQVVYEVVRNETFVFPAT